MPVGPRTRSGVVGRSLLAVLALGLTLGGAAQAAKKLGAPSKFLMQEPNLVVVARVEAKSPPGELRLLRLEEIHGETGEEVTTRIGEAGFALAEIGETYVVGYETVKRVLRARHVYEPDPRGPEVVVLPAIGDALLPDTPAVRLMLREAPTGEREGLERYLAAILETLDGPSVLGQRFAAAELLFAEEIHPLVDQADLAEVRGVLASEEADPLTQDLLLRAGTRLAATHGPEWLAESSREILAAHGTELDMLSPTPALLVTAARVLEETGRPEDVELLATHLPSENPGVAKAALATMRTLDPEASLVQARAALQEGDLHPETRRVLERYLQDADMDLHQEWDEEGWTDAEPEGDGSPDRPGPRPVGAGGEAGAV